MSTPVKVAVVTGASRGIGRAVALRFARGGFRVWALARNDAALEALAQEVGTSGDIRPLRMDATEEASVVGAAATLKADGTPWVLVNNAGVALSAPLPKTTSADWAQTLTVNVTAPYLLCRELMPAMAREAGGRIINIASTAALKGFKYTAAYCASKHALLGLTRALAVEYAAKNVTVNAVCPGWTDTDMLAQSAKSIAKATGRSEDEARGVLADMNPMGRLIRPEDVAELCWFLASDAAAAVTGAAWSMDGGEAA